MLGPSTLRVHPAGLSDKDSVPSTAFPPALVMQCSPRTASGLSLLFVSQWGGARCGLLAGSSGTSVALVESRDVGNASRGWWFRLNDFVLGSVVYGGRCSWVDKIEHGIVGSHEMLNDGVDGALTVDIIEV
ncbi:hypothetical protein GGF37_000620 [Kickxella alabastrina]|nr:hypothetical protein GGF37_000620 [Kickxella alabastrina]